MKIHKTLLLVFGLAIFCASAFAQNSSLIKRTTYKTDKLDFGSGGTLVVAGAPAGSIRVEGWARNEIEISAEVEVQAATDADLATLSRITTFVLQESIGRTTINSVGVHDKKYMKQVGKKLPKALLAMPFRIDYVVKVPRYCDLQIDGGKGDLHISGVEGTMKINYLDTRATIDLVGGAITATFGTGSVDVTVPSRSWRGRFADIQMANGSMNIHLPPSLNAEIDATVLRTGRIENGYKSFAPRVRKAEFTEKSIVAKSGIGGITMKFTVGDGTLRIVETGRPG